MRTRRQATGRPLIDAHHIGIGQGGNETWALNVLRSLTRLGYRCDYALSPQGAHLVRDLLASDQVHVVSGSSARRLVVDLPRLVRRLRPSVILCQYTAALTLRAPLVLVVHDCSYMYPEAKDWLPTSSLLRYRWSISASIARARIVVTPTEYVRADLLRFYPRTRQADVVVAQLAVGQDLQDVLDRTTRATKQASGPQTILSVGNPLPRKNLAVVIQAVKQLNLQSHGSHRLRLVGRVDDRGRASVERAEAELGALFSTSGGVTVEELASEYRAADVVVVPSLNEGFGLPVLEAMAAGTPVVSSSSSCLPEVVGSAGLVVSPHEPSAWTAAIREATEQRADLSDRGVARAGLFSWDATARTVLDAFDAVTRPR